VKAVELSGVLTSKKRVPPKRNTFHII